MWLCEPLDLERVPAVRTGEITIDNETAAVTAIGVLLDMGQEKIIQHGHCWSTSPVPTLEDVSSQLGPVTQTGEFTSILRPIGGNKKYFVRSYLISQNEEIIYGDIGSIGTPREVFFDMSLVAEGTFIMGNDNGSVDERPAHEVALSDFYIMKYEVTQAMWMEFTGLYTESYNPSLNAGCELCPVDQVSWEEIQVFINFVNLNTGKPYRLPTEAEWEYAAKGGNQSNHYIYSGSNDPDEVAWYDANSNNKTHQVGLKKPNELGIYDMSGNVIEWCSDWYDSTYYSHSAVINPLGADSGSFKVSRGGSYFNEGSFTKTSNRSRDVVNERYINYGFRLVLSAD